MKCTKPNHLKLPAESWSLEEIREFCKRVLRSYAIEEKELRHLILAVDEASANVVEHAYPPGKTEYLELAVSIQGTLVSVELRDRGVPFDPRVDGPASVPETFSRGGYGLELIRRTVDEIHYQRSAEGENVLTLKKRVSLSRAGDGNGEQLTPPQ
jgi:serine/threonine-protein kinase RsbW